jgi:hypothetical protein
MRHKETRPALATGRASEFPAGQLGRSEDTDNATSIQANVLVQHI